ncbi:MAG: hypothetical protein ACOYVD_15400 [Bacillota bacterium]
MGQANNSSEKLENTACAEPLAIEEADVALLLLLPCKSYAFLISIKKANFSSLFLFFFTIIAG